MIYGEIKDIKKYKGLSKNLDMAIEYIASGKYKKCEIGRNVLDGDKVFFNCNENIMTKEKNDLVEYHKRYADIHIILEGEEIIGYSDFQKSVETQAYDEEKDYAFMKGEIKTETYMDKDKFAIIFPYEPHMATFKVGEIKTVKKIVFKVEIE